MAKVSAPLLSASAHGSIHKELTFSQRRTHQHARFQKKQRTYTSETQLIQRDKFYVSGVLWQSMPQVERDYWKDIAEKGYTDIE